MNIDTLKKLAATAKLNDMIERGSLDISTVRTVAKMLAIEPAGDAYAILNTLHCVDFDKLADELREAIPALLQQVLGIAPGYEFKTPADQ